MALRHQLFADIAATIEKSKFFRANEFRIEEAKNRAGTPELWIRYFDNVEYQFRVTLPQKKSSDGTFVFGGVVVPGEVSQTQEITFASYYTLHSEISQWLARIKEELTAGPIGRQIAEQQRAIDDLLQKVSTVSPEEYFTRQEAAAMNERLDALEKQLVDQIKAASLDKATTEEKIAVVDNDISVLKSQVSAVPKQSWLRRVAVRFGIWSADPTHRQLLEAGGAVIKGILGSGHGGGHEGEGGKGGG